MEIHVIDVAMREYPKGSGKYIESDLTGDLKALEAQNKNIVRLYGMSNGVHIMVNKV